MQKHIPSQLAFFLRHFPHTILIRETFQDELAMLSMSLLKTLFSLTKEHI